ncbi:MAG: hypothetical protein QW702_08090 [Candidatus Bathyarchaeia archaeon]
MRIYLVRVGEVDAEILDFIRREVMETFKGAVCEISGKTIPLPDKAYNHVRRQFLSEILLSEVLKFAVESERDAGESCIALGVTSADIYAPGMNLFSVKLNAPGNLR